MVAALKLDGQKFGMLSVVRRLPSRAGITVWLASCECGNLREVRGSGREN
jgi:hypothetical protein